MTSALAGKFCLPCRSASIRTTRPGKAFFSGAPVAAKLRSHGVGTRKVTAMNVSALLPSRHYVHLSTERVICPNVLDDVCLQLEFDAVGGPYANALVEIAQEQNSLDDVHADVDALQALFSENEQIKDFLFNPVMTPEKKRDVVKNISKEAGLSKYTTNFLNLLIDKDRIEAIEEILEAFEQTYCKMTDTQVSQIFTPHCLLQYLLSAAVHRCIGTAVNQTHALCWVLWWICIS
jgi:F0F1-type ATP synthase delta subunit